MRLTRRIFIWETPRRRVGAPATNSYGNCGFVIYLRGTALLLRVPNFTQNMAHLGYPAYFLTILGT
jgi:hypothetical protein